MTVYRLGEIEPDSTHTVTARTDWPGATLNIKGFNCVYNATTGTVKFSKTVYPGSDDGSLNITVKYRDPQDSAEHRRNYIVNFNYPT